MKNLPISLPNLFKHTPVWATKAMTILTFMYGLNALCIAYDLYNVSTPILNKINGIYAVGNLVLLSFGVKPAKPSA